MGGDGAIIMKTTDAGNTWTPITITTQPTQWTYFTEIYFIDELRGFVLGDEAYHTYDGGINWFAFPLLKNLHFVDNSIGFARNGPDIMKTINGGASWTQISSPTTNSYGGSF